ncbi:hypothetical protein TNCV_1252481 [Trichonephila clavipes]|nr:hypothetical protein TNCV_1252481 [Trichonephila clavipes]
MAKKSSVLRQERRQTGGGEVPKEAELTDFEMRFLEEPILTLPLSTPFDSDTPFAAARAAACIEEEHRMKIKYMEMDEERKNEEHQLRMEQLRIKIAHAKEKIKAQKILVTTLKGSPKIYLQNTE